MAVRLAVDKQRIAEFCRKWRVKELSVFGSALRDDFGPESDVDVLVELEPDHGLVMYDWLRMIEELQGIFGRRVDLVARGGLKNAIRRERILRTAEVLHAA
ncbi:MAG: nucleotidyltransferase family protein [Armatimonadota bacterium]